MKNEKQRHPKRFFARSYEEYYQRMLGFVASRINSQEDAENLTQDIWLRLLEYDKPIAEETILSLLYTVASNLVNDYLRRLYRSRVVADELRDFACEADWSGESAVMARDLEQLEKNRVECLPPQRRIIYIMSRYDDKSVDDIANELSLSFRTVENHLRMGRHDVRSFMAEAI